MPGAVRVRAASPAEMVTVAVVLRRQAEQAGSGAHQADAERVRTFATDNQIAVSGIDLAARTVSLTGTVQRMNAAFGVDLGQYRLGELTFRGREGDVHVPPTIAPVVTAVLGLDDRPQARAHFIVHSAAGAPPSPPGSAEPQATATDCTPQEVARRYGFPTDLTGAGQSVAVIELGGGYRQADLSTYFAEQGIAEPTVVSVGVDGAANSPGDSADAEVMLDIEVIGAVAPGARVVVYFAPNTTAGFYDAIATAIHDTTNRPSVISISWGQAEAGWTAQAMNAYDALFSDAAAAGITVFAACGDDGANDNVGGSSLNVDFPSASPAVVGCGGTRLTSSKETVWNALNTGHGATGGGVSRHFGLPGYQRDAEVPVNPLHKAGRGVPDVAGNADPSTGYRVRVDGQDQVIGGTSAVAPLWAALTALANQALAKDGAGRVGAPHARMYAAPHALRDIVQGGNGGYQAGPGWDACTGLGVPNGAKTLAVLRP